MHYQFNVKVVHTLTHLILPGHPTLPFEGFRGKYSVGQAHRAVLKIVQQGGGVNAYPLLHFT